MGIPQEAFCLAGAVEKQKLVYVLNRDQAANLTISSPLDAHKSHNIVFSIAGLDMGFDNPVFAAIELDYADTDQVSPGPAVSLVSCWLHHAPQALMKSALTLLQLQLLLCVCGWKHVTDQHLPTMLYIGPDRRGGGRGAEAPDAVRAGPGAEPRHAQVEPAHRQRRQPAHPRAWRR